MAIAERFERRLRDSLAAQVNRLPAAAVGGSFRPTLTVSREDGARAEPVCEQLADYLTAEDESAEFGWTVLNRDLLERTIGRPWLAALLGEPEAAEAAGDGRLHADAIRWLAQLGHTIIIGLCGMFLTADMANVFHIRLVGSEQSRLAYLQRERQLDRVAALDSLRRTERERREFGLAHFQRDIGDPRGYHAVIRTDALRDEVLARMIGDLFMDWAADTGEMWGKLVPMEFGGGSEGRG